MIQKLIFDSELDSLLNLLKTTKIELKTAIEEGYKRYKICKNGKVRWIENRTIN